MQNVRKIEGWLGLDGQLSASGCCSSNWASNRFVSERSDVHNVLIFVLGFFRCPSLLLTIGQGVQQTRTPQPQQESKSID
jgi:hypothetical protein